MKITEFGIYGKHCILYTVITVVRYYYSPSNSVYPDPSTHSILWESRKIYQFRGTKWLDFLCVACVVFLSHARISTYSSSRNNLDTYASRRARRTYTWWVFEYWRYSRKRKGSWRWLFWEPIIDALHFQVVELNSRILTRSPPTWPRTLTTRPNECNTLEVKYTTTVFRKYYYFLAGQTDTSRGNLP